MVEYSCHSVVINHLAALDREIVHQLLLDLVTVSALTSRNVWQRLYHRREILTKWILLHGIHCKEVRGGFLLFFFFYLCCKSEQRCDLYHYEITFCICCQSSAPVIDSYGASKMLNTARGV